MPRSRDCGPGDRSPECLDTGSAPGVPAAGGGDVSTERCTGGQRRDPVTGGCYDPSTPQSLGTVNCRPNEHPVYSAEYPNGACLPNDGLTTTGGGGDTPHPITSAPPRSAPPAPFAYSPSTMEFDKYLQDILKQGLSAPSRYTPEALQALYGEITRQASNRIQQGSAAVRADAARRNMQRAGSTGASLLDVRNQAETAQGQANVGVLTAKINADHQDKLDAIDRAQRYLDSLRDSEYRMQLSAEQRRQYDSNLALSYAQLDQQRTLLEMNLQSQWDMLRASAGYSMLCKALGTC